MSQSYMMFISFCCDVIHATSMLFQNTTANSIFNTVTVVNFQMNFVAEGDTLAEISVYVSPTPDWRSGNLCYQHDLKQPLDNTVNINCVASGRYVTLFNSRNETYVQSLSAFAYINICEIHVAGNQAFII